VQALVVVLFLTLPKTKKKFWRQKLSSRNVVFFYYLSRKSSFLALLDTYCHLLGVAVENYNNNLTVILVKPFFLCL